DIELIDGALTVRGARKQPKLADGTTWALAERAFGAFERTFRVPREIDPDSIAATMENGVLSLIVPKPERPQPKRIAVGTQRELETTTACPCPAPRPADRRLLRGSQRATRRPPSEGTTAG